MVRSWSCLNIFNLEVATFKQFYVFARLKIFRSSINYKRFVNEGTLFKRRHLRKINHKAFWVTYFSVLKYWTLEYQYARHHTRFQYYNKLFVNNYIIYNINYIKRQKLKIFAPQDQWVSAALTRRFYFILAKNKNAEILHSYQSANHVHAFFPTLNIEPNLVTHAVIVSFDSHLYGVNFEEESISDPLNYMLSLYSFNLKLHIEYYQIMYLLIYFSTQNIQLFMFLRFFAFVKLPKTSPASRSSYYFKNKWPMFYRSRHLSLHKKWKAGRGDSGHAISRTKASCLHRSLTFKINHHFRYKKIGFVAHFQFLVFRNKILSLVQFANGSVSYFTTTKRHRIFSFFHFNKHRALSCYFSSSMFKLLFLIKHSTHISLLEVFPGRGAQYCRSAGVSSKIVKHDPQQAQVLVKLPSGARKFFSFYSLVAPGKVAFKTHQKCFNAYAGYRRGFGVKPTVRGVAMNPVDHPHGGRTKAIQYPRTPWGKTTKFK